MSQVRLGELGLLSGGGLVPLLLPQASACKQLPTSLHFSVLSLLLLFNLYLRLSLIYSSRHPLAHRCASKEDGVCTRRGIRKQNAAQRAPSQLAGGGRPLEEQMIECVLLPRPRHAPVLDGRAANKVKVEVFLSCRHACR